MLKKTETEHTLRFFFYFLLSDFPFIPVPSTRIILEQCILFTLFLSAIFWLTYLNRVCLSLFSLYLWRSTFSLMGKTIIIFLIRVLIRLEEHRKSQSQSKTRLQRKSLVSPRFPISIRMLPIAISWSCGESVPWKRIHWNLLKNFL